MEKEYKYFKGCTLIWSLELHAEYYNQDCNDVPVNTV